MYEFAKIVNRQHSIVPTKKPGCSLNISSEFWRNDSRHCCMPYDARKLRMFKLLLVRAIIIQCFFTSYSWTLLSSHSCYWATQFNFQQFLKKNLTFLILGIKMILFRCITAAAMVLHNIIIMLCEDPPTLPPNIQEPEFQNRLQRGQVRVLPIGRPDENQFGTRNKIIGIHFPWETSETPWNANSSFLFIL